MNETTQKSSPTSLSLPGILYGGDYNPEQWPETVWDDDVRLMQEANVNIATLPVFGWVTLQPDEDTFTFEWLDRILDKLSAGGIRICLATATASVPAWVDQKYPDVLVTHENGTKARHGNRHTFCPNSANFRRLSGNLAAKIAERYKDHPAILLWHVSNEYGTYCYCDENCAPAFRVWLQEKYGTLAELNRVWNTAFWGHTYTDWSQIEPALRHGERNVQALRLDYHRFQSSSLLNCYKNEAAILRKITPNIPITTNLMGSFYPLNYREWAKEMDVVSWDNYPGPNAPPAHVAFAHTLMRGLKEGQPFLLMEQSPSQQNWQPYNAVKPPQQLRLQSFQTMAHGADSIMYFQWRRGHGGIEKLHGAIVEHHGRSDTRVFQEVAALGADLKALGTQTLTGRVPARVAVLFDWENWWGISFSSGPSVDLDYRKECVTVYSALHALGIQTDLVAPDADLSRYEWIIAPTMTMVRNTDAEQIKACVQNGATFLTTAFSGLTDENDLVHPGGAPGPLRDLLGLWVEETDALPKDKTNGVRLTREFAGLDEGTKLSSYLLCDRIHPTTAETLATYTDDFYAGEPAFTVNQFGKGSGYYLATHLDEENWRVLLAALSKTLGIGSPLADGAAPPKDVEVTVRIAPETGDELLYVLNHGTTDPVTVPLPAGASYTDLLTGDAITETITLAVRGIAILRLRKDS